MQSLRSCSSGLRINGMLLSAVLLTLAIVVVSALAQSSRPAQRARNIHLTDEDQPLTSPSGRIMLLGSVSSTSGDGFASTLRGNDIELHGRISGIITADDATSDDDESFAYSNDDSNAKLTQRPQHILDILAHWGGCSARWNDAARCAADIDGDGVIGPLDLLAWLSTAH